MSLIEWPIVDGEFAETLGPIMADVQWLCPGCQSDGDLPHLCIEKVGQLRAFARAVADFMAKDLPQPEPEGCADCRGAAFGDLVDELHRVLPDLRVRELPEEVSDAV